MSRAQRAAMYDKFENVNLCFFANLKRIIFTFWENKDQYKSVEHIVNVINEVSLEHNVNVSILIFYLVLTRVFGSIVILSEHAFFSNMFYQNITALNSPFV